MFLHCIAILTMCDPWTLTWSLITVNDDLTCMVNGGSPLSPAQARYYVQHVEMSQSTLAI